MDYLEEKFKTLWRYSGCDDNYQNGFQELVVKYNRPKRYYHTFDGHIKFCVRTFFEHIVFQVKNPICVLWQLILHDAVMDFRRSDEMNCEAREYVLGYNDIRSAEHAREFLSKYGASAIVVDKVIKAIVYHDHRQNPHDEDISFGLDADLFILAQSQDVFDEYESNIRKEYAWVEELAFRKGRSEILSNFLNNRPSIFLTSYFKNKYEKQARKNLRKSILKLNKK